MADELDDLDALAAGYVLGQLDAAEHAEAARLLVADAAFARRVTEWERRLLPLAEAVPPVTPPADLWRRIEAETGAAESGPALGALARPPLLARLQVWRWAAGLSAAVAAALALFIVLQPTPPSSRWVAVLGEGGAEPAWLVTLDLDARRVTVRPIAVETAGATAPDRALELWLLAAETPPRSLGLLDPAGVRSLALPASTAALAPGSALAVSVEPEGGSPTGLPTGPVIFKGSLLALGDD